MHKCAFYTDFLPNDLPQVAHLKWFFSSMDFLAFPENVKDLLLVEAAPFNVLTHVGY